MQKQKYLLDGAFNGSYKLSPSILTKIFQKEITITENGKEKKIKGISDYELRCLIFFTHICDESGFIESIHWQEVEVDARIPERTYLNVLNGLERKGFIEIKRNSDGYNQVKILNNDFRDFNNMKNKNYLSTAYPFMDETNLAYSNFLRLSLFAKKTLLCIIMLKSSQFGFRAEYKTIADYLNIKNKGLINKYIEEINKFIFNEIASSTDYIVDESGKELLKKEIKKIQNNEDSDIEENYPTKKVPFQTFYKRYGKNRKAKNGYITISPKAFDGNSFTNTTTTDKKNTYFRHLMVQFFLRKKMLIPNLYRTMRTPINAIYNAIFLKLQSLRNTESKKTEKELFETIKQSIISYNNISPVLENPNFCIDMIKKEIKLY